MIPHDICIVLSHKQKTETYSWASVPSGHEFWMDFLQSCNHCPFEGLFMEDATLCSNTYYFYGYF